MASGCVGRGQDGQGGQGSLNEGKVCLGKSCLKVELAQTPEEHTKGLMSRDSLDADSGMLFVFQGDGVYSFWMNGTRIPLDMIWIDRDRRIVFIEENARPCLPEDCRFITPSASARYVLEVNAGTAERMGMKTGDGLDFFLQE